MNLKRGFTLIELALALTLLGILAVLAVSRFMDLRHDAEVAAEEAIVAAVREGIHIYYAESLVSNRTPLYPPNLDDAAVGPASESNPLFTEVLDSSITGGGWMKPGVIYYQGPTGTIYYYDSFEGSFKKFPTPHP